MAKNQSLISPYFRVPIGAEDEFEYTEEIVFDDGESVGDSEDGADGLDVPLTFTIISQSVKRVKGKVVSVDVVFETEEIGGATDYDVQWSEA